MSYLPIFGSSILLFFFREAEKKSRVFLNRILFAVQLYISVKRGIYIALHLVYFFRKYRRKFEAKFSSKRKVKMIEETLWIFLYETSGKVEPEASHVNKIYSELHYTSAHPGTSIPSEVKMSEAERKEVRKKKYLEGYHSYQIIKLSKEQEKSKSKRAQRKSHLSHL